MNKLKFAVTVFAVLLCSISYGQFERGRMLAGGTFSFSATNNKTKNGNTTTVTSSEVTFGLAPQFGYFVADRFVVGALLSIESTSEKSKNNAGSNYNSATATFGPFVRYYMGPGFFIEPSFTFGPSNRKYDVPFGGTQEMKYFVTKATLGAGYAIFLNKNVAVEPMIAYKVLSYADTDNSKQKFTNGGVYLQAGFQVYLR